MTRSNSGKKSQSSSSSPDKKNTNDVSHASEGAAGIDKALLDLVKSSIADMKKDILSSIKRDISEAVKPLSDKLSSAIDCLEDAQKDIKELQCENKKLTKLVNDMAAQLEKQKTKEVLLSTKFNELLERQIAQETYTRKESLIFYGIPQDNDEKACVDRLQSFMKNNLQIPENIVDNMQFQRCHRMNKKMNPQPIICRFLCFPDRMTIWKARTKLKGTSFSISEDFPPEILARRKVLYPIMKAARKDQKKAYMNGDTLEIDGRVYTFKNLHTLPETYNPARLATVQKNNITAFYSKSSPLSNFYPVDLVVDGQNYSTVEQFFQEQKAIFGGKQEVARKIRSTTDPALCKKLGDGITVDNENWFPVAQNAMRKACYEKFNRNPIAKMWLKNTGDSDIVEAGPDKVWGVGFKLNDPRVHIKSEIENNGLNYLGKILMAIRSELCN